MPQYNGMSCEGLMKADSIIVLESALLYFEFIESIRSRSLYSLLCFSLIKRLSVNR
mgnify:CR=1 FL=1|jgi:hypothetical protein